MCAFVRPDLQTTRGGGVACTGRRGRMYFGTATLGAQSSLEPELVLEPNGSIRGRHLYIMQESLKFVHVATSTTSALK